VPSQARSDIFFRCDAEYPVKGECHQRPLRPGNDSFGGKSLPLMSLRHGEADLDLASQRAESHMTDPRGIGP
jgi:hypothetical protein